jgi:hypothetical protein
MDVHVPEAVTAGLRQRGVDVLTTQEDSATRLADELLLEQARKLGRVLYSQDKHFLSIVHHWQVANREFAGLVYAHQLSISIGEAVRDLELIAKALDPADMRNRIEFIPFS